MKPADLRNATWAEVQTHLTADMLRVHAAWLQFGPGTTRQVAERSGISLLTLRPRTTDLYQIGLVGLDDSAGNEGIYSYRTEEQAREAQTWRVSAAKTRSAARPAPAFLRTVPARPSRTQLSWAAAIMATARANKRAGITAAQSTTQLELIA